MFGIVSRQKWNNKIGKCTYSIRPKVKEGPPFGFYVSGFREDIYVKTER